MRGEDEGGIFVGGSWAVRGGSNKELHSISISIIIVIAGVSLSLSSPCQRLQRLRTVTMGHALQAGQGIADALTREPHVNALLGVLGVEGVAVVEIAIHVAIHLLSSPP